MKKLKCKTGGVISNITKTGYLPDSPDRNNDYNIIPSNQITMDKVQHPVYGIDDQGNQQMMYPGNNYSFPGNYVTEIPVKKTGGSIHIKKSHEGKFTAWAKNHGYTMSEAIQAGKNSKDTSVRKMATFAANAQHWKQEGGEFFQQGGIKQTSNPYTNNFSMFDLPDPFQHYKSSVDNNGQVWGSHPGIVSRQDTDQLANPQPESFINSSSTTNQVHHNSFMNKVFNGANNFASGAMDSLNDPNSFYNTMGTATNLINEFGNHKDKDFNDYLRNHMTGDNFAVRPDNISGDRGDYQVTGTSYGMFRPDQLGAKSPYGTNSGMYYPRAKLGGALPGCAGGGYIPEEVSSMPQFYGNTSTREMASGIPEMPGMPAVGPSNTPINFPTYNSNKQVTVNNNTKAAYDYYTQDKGLPSHIAAGIVGNLYQESGLKPGAVETTNTAAGRGIAQWGVNGRWQGFLNWAKQSDRDPYDLKSQLDYVLVEPGESGKAMDKLKNTTTPEEAAVIFGKVYERPAEKYANWDTRTSIANKLANGQYQLGGSYEMSDKEIELFRQAGGEIDFI